MGRCVRCAGKGTLAAGNGILKCSECGGTGQVADEEPKCGFCQRPKSEVRGKRLIQSTVDEAAFICYDCVEVCDGAMKNG